MTHLQTHIYTYTCPIIFLTPFVSMSELVLTQKSLMSFWVAEPTNTAWSNPSSSPPLSLALCLSLSTRIMRDLRIGVLYGVTDYYGAHTAPRLQGIVPGHTMVPGPVSATHPCPSLLVRARGIVSLRLTPISPLFRILQGCPAKCCSQ